VKVGLAVNAPLAISDSYVGTDSQGTGKYGPQVTFSGGFVFEKDYLKDKLTIAPEIVYATGSFKEQMSVFDKDSAPDGEDPVATNLDDVIKMSWIEVNPLVKWWLSKDPSSRDGKFEPFLIGGPGFNYVIKASFEDGKLNHTDGAGTNTGPGVDITGLYKRLNYSAIVGAGVRLRIAGVYAVADARIQYGLSNLIARQTSPETTFDYAYSPNDYKLNRVTLNVQIQLARFDPKKTH